MKNPLDRLLLIICSVETERRQFLASYRALHRAYPTAASLATSTVPHLTQLLSPACPKVQKAIAIRSIIGTLVPLKRLSDADCERFLMALPQVGKKVARYVMMYALRRDVFPVDCHCWRIERRLGWIRPTRPDGSCSPRDMDRLQAPLPERLRYWLHVNFVSLGRDICTAHRPACGRCPVERLFPKVGVAPALRRAA